MLSDNVVVHLSSNIYQFQQAVIPASHRPRIPSTPARPAAVLQSQIPHQYLVVRLVLQSPQVTSFSILV